MWWRSDRLIRSMSRVMRISDIVEVSRSLDDRYRCSVGDAAAALWGFRSAVFVRSSASHVFVTELRRADSGSCCGCDLRESSAIGRCRGAPRWRPH
jgi:hypothetical protein